jgi:outer membrane protein assembly factor BamB
VVLVVLVAVAGAVAVVRIGDRQTRDSPSIPTTPPFSSGRGATAAADQPQAWNEYHADDAHTGTVSTPPLLPSTAAWTSPALDGDVYGEPLFADGLILVGTTNDTADGLDPATGQVRWSTHLATPVPLSQLPCGDVDPLGILSTPVIDPALHRMFVVAEEEAAGGGVQHELVGLDTRSGAIATRQLVDPPGMDVRFQQQRSSLILDQGRVIVAFGGLDGDCGEYNGWLVSASETGTGPLQAYATPGNEVAMWSAGGPVVDGSGDIYMATGNGSSTTTYDEGNSVLKFSPSLQLLDSFAVSQWADDNASDRDLDSAGPVLLGSNLLFEAGKRPTGYLLDTTHLGGIGGQRFAGADGCSSFGSEAWSPPMLYVACSSGPMRAFEVNTGAATFTPAWTSAGPGDGPPIVAGGAVWSEDWQGGTLYAYDPATGKTLASFPTGAADHFVTPSVVGDEVVVGIGRQLHAYAGPAANLQAFWGTTSDGGVDSYDGAPFRGSAGGVALARPVVGMASTPDHGGYWLVASDGGVFSFGDAAFHGSTGAMRLNKPIVGMAATPTGRGYWLVASDGGVFSFGDAAFHGSTGAMRLNKPIVGMAATPTGRGYWLVASDGGIFTFGDALFDGSAAGAPAGSPIVGMAAGPSGYWLVAANGNVLNFGEPLLGTGTGLGAPVVALAAKSDGSSYVLLAANGQAQVVSPAASVTVSASPSPVAPAVGAASAA